MRIILTLFICTFVHFLCSATTNDISFTIMASGETHAMLFPCDCPKEPGGGMAKRSFLIKSMGDSSKLLLDAGGFAGGGIYDSYTEGKRGDSIRTILTLKAMGALGYDAAAIGDDDLQYGAKWLADQAGKAGVKLISANCRYADGKSVGEPYILIKKGNYTFAVTAVTSQEQILTIDKTVTVSDPVSVLKKIWNSMVKNSDYQIIISHLGQEKTSDLARHFPDCDLILNGHRKNDSQAMFKSGAVPVLQFGFEGKSLSYGSFRTVGKKASLVKSGWIDVIPELPDDSAIVKIISNKSQAAVNNVYDLYIMGQCPYGIQALSEFVIFLRSFPSVEWNLWFIGTVGKDSSLSSLHGEGEVREEKIWLAVKNLFPDKWIEFLRQRTIDSLSVDSIIQRMGIDKQKIYGWVNANGKKELALQYLRSERLNINASPTLLINNAPFEKDILATRLYKIQCGVSDNDKVCKSLPECIDDSDCKKTGKLGKCTSGKCKYQDALPFSFKVIIADSTTEHPETNVIQTTTELFPGAKVEVFKMSSPEGKELAAKYKPGALPFYIFGKDVTLAYNFSEVEKGLVERNGALVFKDAITRVNYLPGRKPCPGKVSLYVDPFFRNIPDIFSIISGDDSLASVRIMPIFYGDPSSTPWGTEEKFRQEEALRWLELDKTFNKKYHTYLNEYSKNPATSFWQSSIKKAGILLDSFITNTKRDSLLLTNHWGKLQEMMLLNDPVILLINNNELITVKDERDLARKLKKVVVMEK